ncbi:MAG: hypothetical protein ACKESC_01215, partial [Candidatus Hodgkinia cicadicola]
QNKRLSRLRMVVKYSKASVQSDVQRQQLSQEVKFGYWNHTIIPIEVFIVAIRHFVVNEGTNPLVECYACLGPWLVVDRTGPGGRPHAEVICFSMVSGKHHVNWW